MKYYYSSKINKLYIVSRGALPEVFIDFISCFEYKNKLLLYPELLLLKLL